MAGIQQRRLEDWNAWKGGDPKGLDNLLYSLAPMTEPKTRQLISASQLPPSVVRAEVKHRTIEALNAYDPSRGAQISTHVVSRLPKANEFVMSHTASARLPERRRLMVSTFKNVESELQTRLGREPTTFELQDELLWSRKDVERMRRELRQEVSIERLPTYFDLPQVEDQKVKDALEWLPYDLTPDELKVYEGLTGWGGAPTYTTKQLAKKMRKTEHGVRKLRENVANKLSQRIDVMADIYGR